MYFRSSASGVLGNVVEWGTYHVRTTTLQFQRSLPAWLVQHIQDEAKTVVLLPHSGSLRPSTPSYLVFHSTSAAQPWIRCQSTGSRL